LRVLQIHVPVANRPALAMESVKILRETLGGAEASITVWLDGFWDQGVAGFSGANSVVHCRKAGIEKLRGRHLEAWNADQSDWLYFTDADAIHAPGWFDRLRELSERTGLMASGYRTASHDWNARADHEDWIEHKYTSGISMLMGAEHVRKILPRLTDDREIRCSAGGFDWAIPEILGGCAVTRESVVDHVGVGGMHHPEEGGRGDRALNPVDGIAEIADDWCARLTRKR